MTNKYLNYYNSLQLSKLSSTEILKLQVTNNFKVKEIVCNHCLANKDKNKILSMIAMYRTAIIEQCNKLEVVRHLIKKPLFVNSFLRCQEHNENVGGSKTSAHLKGNATDLQLRNIWTAIQTDKQVLSALTGMFDEIIINLKKGYIHLAIDNEFLFKFVV